MGNGGKLQESEKLITADIKPSQIRGYDTHVNRDGAVVYSSGGKPVLLDRGLFIEVANVPAEKGKNLAMALHILGQKSGEKVEVRGDKSFVQGTLQCIPHFNASSGKTVPMTHPAQRRQAGYDLSQMSDSPPVSPSRVPNRFTPP